MAHEQTLKDLQKAVSMELSAAHQYQLHAHVLEDWGIDRLANQIREEMAEELEHSDAFVERIMFLKGDPQLSFDKPPARAQSLTDMFERDLADEKEAIEFYTNAAARAAEAGDHRISLAVREDCARRGGPHGLARTPTRSRFPNGRAGLHCQTHVGTGRPPRLIAKRR